MSAGLVGFAIALDLGAHVCWKQKWMLFGLLAYVLSGLCIYWLVHGEGVINVDVANALVSGGSVVGVFLVSCLVFRDGHSTREYLGIAAVVVGFLLLFPFKKTE